MALNFCLCYSLLLIDSSKNEFTNAFPKVYIKNSGSLFILLVSFCALILSPAPFAVPIFTLNVKRYTDKKF